MNDYSSPLLKRPGAVPADGDDAAVAAHYGVLTKEQRALESGRAVVDLSHRSVVTVSGPDRLSWLTTLSSQKVDALKPGDSSELLLLDISGRIEHAVSITDDGETAWLITEASHGDALAEWLDSMKFMLRVEITNRTADYAVLGSTEALPEQLPSPAAARWEDPWPALAPGGESYAAVIEEAHPAAEWTWWLTVVEQPKFTSVIESLEAEGWSLAGVLAAEALRIAAWRPRLAREVDEKAIPHELDLIRTAVHLSKGCYRGQETVARVHNLGHPPRRLVFLHLDGSEHTLPAVGSDVLAPKDPSDQEALVKERAVGTVTSVARHHEMGPIALALVKRRVDPESALVVRDVPQEDGADGKGDASGENINADGETTGVAEDAAPAPTFYAAAQELIVRPDAGQTVGRPKGDFLRAPRS